MEIIQLKMLLENLREGEELILFSEIGTDLQYIRVDNDYLNANKEDKMAVKASYLLECGWFNYRVDYMDERTVEGIDLNEIRSYQIRKKRG